ncbi:MAG: BACON domain-containing protein [Bryobacteraceae bacterium]
MPYQIHFRRYLLRALFLTVFLGLTAVPSMAQCSYSVNPATTPDIPAAGGNGTFQLQTQTGCSWTALPNVDWIVITSLFSGSGSTQVTFVAQFNPTETLRTGNINIGGQTVTVNQLGNPACAALSIAMNSTRTGSLASGDCRSSNLGVNFYADRYTFSGEANQTVFIGLRSDSFATQLFVKAPAPNNTNFNNSGGGGGNNSRIPANSGLVTLPVAGIYTVEVTSLSILQTGSYSLDLYQASGADSNTQASRVHLGVPYFYSQTIVNATEEGGDPVHSCTAQRDYKTLWYDVTPTFSGTLDISTAGSGYDTVLSVYQNNAELACNNDAPSGGPTSRLSVNVVAGQTYVIEVSSVNPNPGSTNMFLTINSTGGSCVYQLGSPGQQVNSIGGNFSFSINTASACSWQAQSNSSWINITSGSGLGNGTISYTVSANVTGSQRVGTITVAGLTFTVTQLAGSCSFTLTPAGGQAFPVSGGVGTITVDTQAGCSWTVSNIANWIALNKSGGTGPDVVSYLVSQNNTGTSRQASVTIGSQSFSITQTTATSLLSITAPVSNQIITVSGVTFQWSTVPTATGYEVRVANSSAVVFSGVISGANSTSTLVSLPNGNYTFSVRDCSNGAFNDANCGTFTSVAFSVAQAAPTSRPTITAPTASQVFTTSTQAFSWSTVSDASYYEVELRNNTANIVEYTISNFGAPPATSTIFTMRGASYSLRVRACISACSDWSDAVTFSVNLPAAPAAAPGTPSCNVAGGNQLTCNWNAIAGADFYLLQAVQPNTGPGGGALTAASRFVNTNSLSAPVLVPAGPFSVFVAACNGNGCGPYSPPLSMSAAGPNPSAPSLGNPLSGAITSSQPVFFSWNRIPSDNGTNTVYRLFVADLSRGGTALDVQTTSNFYSASFKAGGSRYDALVVSNPDTVNQLIGPASGFILQGNNPTSPTLVQPRHQTPEVTSTIAGGNMQLGWTPIPGSTLYEYFVAISGQPNPIVRGVTPGLVVQVPLGAAGGNITSYSGIVRACLPGSACVFGSDAGWGPWSNQPGGAGVTTFLVRP